MDGKIDEEIITGKQPALCTDSTLQQLKKPIHKATYKKGIINVEGDDQCSSIRFNDKFIVGCDICGKQYTRYNKTKHYKTQHHIFCEKINKKWRSMILDN